MNEFRLNPQKHLKFHRRLPGVWAELKTTSNASPWKHWSLGKPTATHIPIFGGERLYARGLRAEPCRNLSKSSKPLDTVQRIPRRLIHALEFLCGTTICRPLPRGVSRLRRHSLTSRRAFYARSCTRTSQNTPSTHSSE
jgi:hypothetical protein